MNAFSAFAAVAALLVPAGLLSAAEALSQQDVVAIARSYLATVDEDDLAQCAARLAEYQGEIEPVLEDGFRPDYCSAVEHNRWLTLNEATEGELEYDELVDNDSNDFDTWRLEHRKLYRRGASIEAVSRGDNVIDVTTRNVARFTVWLHPRMVDVNKPVTIVVDGRPRQIDALQPSLLTALDSYRRRRDWGLLYPMKVELAAKVVFTGSRTVGP